MFTADLLLVGITYAACADDIALITIGRVRSETISRFENYLVELLHYCDKWRIKMILKVGLPLHIPWRNLVCSTAKDKDDFTRVMRTCNILINAVYTAISRKSEMSSLNQILIAECIFQDPLLFALQVKGRSAAFQLNRLKSHTTSFLS